MLGFLIKIFHHYMYGLPNYRFCYVQLNTNLISNDQTRRHADRFKNQMIIKRIGFEDKRTPLNAENAP